MIFFYFWFQDELSESSEDLSENTTTKVGILTIYLSDNLEISFLD